MKPASLLCQAAGVSFMQPLIEKTLEHTFSWKFGDQTLIILGATFYSTLLAKKKWSKVAWLKPRLTQPLTTFFDQQGAGQKPKLYLREVVVEEELIEEAEEERAVLILSELQLGVLFQWWMSQDHDIFTV